MGDMAAIVRAGTLRRLGLKRRILSSSSAQQLSYQRRMAQPLNKELMCSNNNESLVRKAPRLPVDQKSAPNFTRKGSIPQRRL
jgi:hypothetical protein